MKDRYSILLILVFLGMLLIPWRTLALDPHGIEESFYPRPRLISLISNLRIALGDRVFPKVIVGDHNWLVFTGEGDLQDYQKLETFTAEELAQLQSDLDALSAKYAERGVTLLIVIVPSKNTIYPERVPAQIPVIGEESRLEQVMSTIHTSGPTRILDLRPALLAAKAEREIYYATDTHWNDYGAYIAYSAILSELSQTYPNLAPRPVSDFYPDEAEPQILDLAQNIGTTLLTESKINFVPNFDQRTSYKSITLGGRKMIFSYHPDATLPNLVTYYDSFFFPVNSMLGEHFHRGLFIQNHTGGGLWNLSWVDEQQPEVVIIEFSERYLDDLPKFIAPAP